MPSKPRGLHLPTSAAAASAATKPAGAARTWTPPKPHLANFHFDSAAAASSAFASSAGASGSDSSHYVPPVSPQLPARRKPAFSPGGFGLQFQPPPAPGFEAAKGVLGNLDGRSSSGGSKGKEREIFEGGQAVLTEVERRRREIQKEEERMEGRIAVEEGKEEAEACYVPPPATLHFHSSEPLPLLYSPQPLPPYDIAYETWGKLNADKSNAILLHTGLSASSHVASGGNDVSSSTSSRPGWWEDFVGSGKSIDTDRFFVICTNVLGGCFGSTGPSSTYPLGEDTNVRWATRFPLLSVHDMTRAQLSLLDFLGIDKLYASVGASMGGMQSLSLAYLAPERVGRVASISATGRSGLGGVGMRYAQRSVLMADPDWNRGFYYDGVPPHNGMKLARQIATITYRSGPEWEQRFARRMMSEKEGGIPRLSPDFLIETYLDHQGERFCLTYDANSMIYLSKAMDLFDLTAPALTALADRYAAASTDPSVPPFPYPHDPPSVSASSPRPAGETIPLPDPPRNERFIPTSKSPHLPELAAGLRRLKDIPALVLGVQSDVLFPVEQQRELADALKMAGNGNVTYYELGGVWGHDTFLLDVQNVGGALRGFLG